MSSTKCHCFIFGSFQVKRVARHARQVLRMIIGDLDATG